jgi:hypothetical protein
MDFPLYPPATKFEQSRVHFFGTATLSFSEGIETREGDVFEIEAEVFTLPVRNPLVRQATQPLATARSL